jgi:hypothetical protein
VNAAVEEFIDLKKKGITRSQKEHAAAHKISPTELSRALKYQNLDINNYIRVKTIVDKDTFNGKVKDST